MNVIYSKLKGKLPVERVLPPPSSSIPCPLPSTACLPLLLPLFLFLLSLCIAVCPLLWL